MKFVLKIDDVASVLIEAGSLKEAKESFTKLFGDLETVASIPTETAKTVPSKGLFVHLLRLKEEGFFSEPRSLSDIKKKLKEYAVHYPSTSFPFYLNNLVKERKLRRFQEKRGGKTLWVYVNN